MLMIACVVRRLLSSAIRSIFIPPRSCVHICCHCHELGDMDGRQSSHCIKVGRELLQQRLGLRYRLIELGQ